MMKALKKLNKPVFIWAGLAILFILAVFSHFYGLSWRPAHHDEAMLSYFAWKLSSQGSYTYTPQIHSPILFYVQALVYKFFGAGQNTLRVGPAVFGVALIFIPILFRKVLKNKNAFWLSILFLTSTIILYFTRFLVHTSMVIVFWLLAVLCLKWFFDRPSMLPLHLAVLFFAFAFGTSESTYIFAAILLAFIPAFFIFSKSRFLKYWHLIRDFFKEDPYQLLSAFLLFVLSWVAIYSVGATSWQSLRTSFPNPFDPTTGLGFWLSQNPHRLGGQSWFYYILLIAIYEPVILITNILAIISLRTKKSILYFFAIWWAVISMVAYSWAGEKFPWLALCPLVAMIFLAGLYIGNNWDKFKLWLKIALGVLILFSVFNSIRVNFTHIADTRELLTYVQTPLVFQQKIDKINQDCGNSASCVAIDQSISWPMSWSFKDSSFLFYPDSKNTFEKTRYIILSNDNAGSFEAPQGFSKESIQLRDWWVADKCSKISCARKYFDYFMFRKIYNAKGGFDAVVFHRSE